MAFLCARRVVNFSPTYEEAANAVGYPFSARRLVPDAILSWSTWRFSVTLERASGVLAMAVLIVRVFYAGRYRGLYPLALALLDMRGGWA